MWDLDTIRRMNEQAHLEAVERAKEKAGQVVRPAFAPVFPLSDLARLLVVGPPSLSYLTDLIENSDVFATFHELVKEYLPEHDAFIMAQDEDGRIREFAHYFGQQYFPLSDNIYMSDLTLGDFCREIPVELMGFSYDDFHGFMDFREGHVLMLSLVESPFVDDNDGGRVPILERVTELVGRGLVELIPPKGWSTEDLHRMLDNTDYEELIAFGDWVNANTGCLQLDATYDEYEGEQWIRHVVDQLTTQWPQVVDIQNRIQNMAEWLEEDIRYNFRTLLAFMLDRKDLIVPKEQLAFPLDENGQVIREEVMANGDHRTARRI